MKIGVPEIRTGFDRICRAEEGPTFPSQPPHLSIAEGRSIPDCHYRYFALLLADPPPMLASADSQLMLGFDRFPLLGVAIRAGPSPARRSSFGSRPLTAVLFLAVSGR